VIPAAAEPALRATEADRAALAEVLARPEFQDRLADGLALRRTLLGWWDAFLAMLETPEAERYAGLGRLVFLSAAAAAAALLWRAARRRAEARRTGARAAGAARGGDREGAGDGPLDPAAALAAAATALDAGDPAGAVRAAWAAVAGALGTADLTGPELAARRGDAALAGLARLHERTLFGRRPVTLGEAARSVEVARRLAAGRTPPGLGAGEAIR